MDLSMVARLGRLGGWPPRDNDAETGLRQLSLSVSWALFAVHWHALLLGAWIGLLLGGLAQGAVSGLADWPLPVWSAALILGHRVWLRQMHAGPHRMIGLPWRMLTIALIGALGSVFAAGLLNPSPTAIHALGAIDLGLTLSPLLARAGLSRQQRLRGDSALRAAALARSGAHSQDGAGALLDGLLAVYGWTATLLLGLVGALLILACRAVRVHREGSFAFVCPRDDCGLRLENPRLTCVACDDSRPGHERCAELRTWPRVAHPLLAVCPLCRRPHPVWRTLSDAARRRELFASPVSCRHACGPEAIDGHRRLRIAVLVVGPDGIARLLRQLQDATGVDRGQRLPGRPPIHRALFVPPPGREQTWRTRIKGHAVQLRVHAFDLLQARQWIGGFDLALLLTLPDPVLSPEAQARLMLTRIEVDRTPLGPAPRNAPRRRWRRLLGPAHDRAEITHLRGRHPRLALIHADGRSRVEPPSPEITVIQGRDALRQLMEETLT